MVRYIAWGHCVRAALCPSQVVSGCHGGVVSVWDVDTGEKTIQFSRCHGDAEITAMAFDSTGRRLLTGGRDGSLRMWNFNNGACLSVLKSHYSTEVSWEGVADG